MIKNYEKEITKTLGMCGTIISGSKSGYRDRNPNNLVVFNSNICVVEGEEVDKIWFGDIDLTLSKQKLVDLSRIMNKTIVVLYEMDGRFENELKPLIYRYIYKINPDGTESLGDDLNKYFNIVNGVIKSSKI